MNEKLLKQLREGNIALKNDGTLDELNKVLRYAFPCERSRSTGIAKYYFAGLNKDYWTLEDTTDLPTHSVKEFLKPESEYPKVMRMSCNPIKTKEDLYYTINRVVFMEKNNKFIAWGKATTLEEAEYETEVFTWNYAVDLDWQPEEETKPLKLTMEQIAEKFNAEKIEIVNYEK